MRQPNVPYVRNLKQYLTFRRMMLFGTLAQNSRNAYHPLFEYLDTFTRNMLIVMYYFIMLVYGTLLLFYFPETQNVCQQIYLGFFSLRVVKLCILAQFLTCHLWNIANWYHMLYKIFTFALRTSIVWYD